MFIKHKLDNSYKKITFLVISNDPKISFSQQPFDISVHNLSDLAKKICELDEGHFNEIYAYCEDNFSIYFPNNNRAMLEPTLHSSIDPALRVLFYLCANTLDVNEEHITCSENDIRNQLIDLKNKLSTLSEEQRWFIYRVMSWTMEHYKRQWIECCCIPRTVLEKSITGMNTKDLKDIAESLEHLNIGRYDDEIRYIGKDGFYVYYNNNIPQDFDYFAGIVIFLRKTLDKAKQNETLEKIIVDCDFSYIN